MEPDGAASTGRPSENLLILLDWAPSLNCRWLEQGKGKVKGRRFDK